MEEFLRVEAVGRRGTTQKIVRQSWLTGTFVSTRLLSNLGKGFGVFRISPCDFYVPGAPGVESWATFLTTEAPRTQRLHSAA